MKKILSAVFILVFLSSFICVFAKTPVDGDVANVYGIAGITIDGANNVGVPVKFSKAQGASWASRVSYINPVKLDGLTITLKNVTIAADKSYISLGLTSDLGGWIDNSGLYFINSNLKADTNNPDRQFGNVQLKHGKDLADVKTKTLANTIAQIKTNVTFQFNKLADGSWQYTFNGQKFPLAATEISENIPNVNAVYLSFGTWGNPIDSDVNYTIADIKAANISETVSKPASSVAAVSSSSATVAANSSSAASSSVADQSSQAASTIVSTGSTASTSTSSVASSSGQQKSNNLIIPIIIIVILLIACGVGGFFIYKQIK